MHDIALLFFLSCFCVSPSGENFVLYEGVGYLNGEYSSVKINFFSIDDYRHKTKTFLQQMYVFFLDFIFIIIAVRTTACGLSILLIREYFSPCRGRGSSTSLWW